MKPAWSTSRSFSRIVTPTPRGWAAFSRSTDARILPISSVRASSSAFSSSVTTLCTREARARLSSRIRERSNARKRKNETPAIMRMPAIVNQSTSAPKIDSRERTALRLQDIADAADRVDELLIERIVPFLPEPADGHIDHIRVGVEIHVPDLFGDDRPRQDLAGAPNKEREQRELLRREVELPPAPTRALPDDGDFDVRS